MPDILLLMIIILFTVICIICTIGIIHDNIVFIVSIIMLTICNFWFSICYITTPWQHNYYEVKVVNIQDYSLGVVDDKLINLNSIFNRSFKDNSILQIRATNTDILYAYILPTSCPTYELISVQTPDQFNDGNDNE